MAIAEQVGYALENPAYIALSNCEQDALSAEQVNLLAEDAWYTLATGRKVDAAPAEPAEDKEKPAKGKGKSSKSAESAEEKGKEKGKKGKGKDEEEKGKKG